MKNNLCVALTATPEQAEKLRELQTAFAQVCNALSPLVQEHRCWNRVTLHHLAYKGLREKFPAMGSQMTCNAIYAVSLASRVVFQHPASPYHHTKFEGKRLPLLRFSDQSPVYFDRHTLSIKPGLISLYTLGGRMHCDLQLARKDEMMFREQKLRDVVLTRRPDGVFQLLFSFVQDQDKDNAVSAKSALAGRDLGAFPSHVQLEASA
jgi:hypothetical protein